MGLTWTGGGPALFIRQLQSLDGAVTSHLQTAMGEIAQLVERRAKELAPVDTGTLRASIGHVVNRMGRDAITAIIGSDVEYAPYQEYGTYKMAAQPFLRPALEQSRDEIVRILEDAYSSALRSL